MQDINNQKFWLFENQYLLISFGYSKTPRLLSKQKSWKRAFSDHTQEADVWSAIRKRFSAPPTHHYAQPRLLGDLEANLAPPGRLPIHLRLSFPDVLAHGYPESNPDNNATGEAVETAAATAKLQGLVGLVRKKG